MGPQHVPSQTFHRHHPRLLLARLLIFRHGRQVARTWVRGHGEESAVGEPSASGECGDLVRGRGLFPRCCGRAGGRGERRDICDAFVRRSGRDGGGQGCAQDTAAGCWEARRDRADRLCDFGGADAGELVEISDGRSLAQLSRG